MRPGTSTPGALCAYLPWQCAVPEGRRGANAGAAEFVVELIKSEDPSDIRAVQTLARMLIGPDAKLKAEGERLLRLLNSDRHRHDALRKLKQTALPGEITFQL